MNEQEKESRNEHSFLFYLLLALFPLIALAVIFVVLTMWPLLLVAVLGGMAGGWIVWTLARQ